MQLMLFQDQVVEMQQNLRAAMEVMTGDIRMATYDPDGNAGASITTATPTTLAFTADLDDSGAFVTGGVADPNETISYAFGDTNGNGTNDDSDNNGIVDQDDNGDGVVDRFPFRRSTGGAALQPIAENIQAIEFYYVLDDGTEVADPSATGQLDQIQAVKISMLAIAEQRSPNYTNNQTYTRASGGVWGPFNDGFRRRLLISTVYIRNRGMM